jgi:hypothetical protein
MIEILRPAVRSREGRLPFARCSIVVFIVVDELCKIPFLRTSEKFRGWKPTFALRGPQSLDFASKTIEYADPSYTNDWHDVLLL